MEREKSSRNQKSTPHPHRLPIVVKGEQQVISKFAPI